MIHYGRRRGKIFRGECWWSFRGCGTHWISSAPDHVVVERLKHQGWVVQMSYSTLAWYVHKISWNKKIDRVMLTLAVGVDEGHASIIPM